MTNTRNKANDELTPDEVREQQNGLTEKEQEKVAEHSRLRAAVVYEIIGTEGEGELNRGVNALWWSGLAAGLSIGFSVVSEALLSAYLPDEPWKPLIDNLGYSVGFLIVIMARQQLFTENTLTPVLPVMKRRKLKWVLILLRLWIIVLFANLVGCLIFASVLAYTDILNDAVRQAVVAIGQHMMENSAPEMFVKAIAAGWLIAVLVWILPSAEGAEFFVIGLLTYLIALGDFTHVIAGATEAFYLLLTGHLALGAVIFQFLLPTLAGNVVGGTVLFAVLSYAQVKEEI
jgi:formate/nitrite transporter FocA (FNT family)